MQTAGCSLLLWPLKLAEQGLTQSFPHPRVAWRCSHLEKKVIYILRDYMIRSVTLGYPFSYTSDSNLFSITDLLKLHIFWAFLQNGASGRRSCNVSASKCQAQSCNPHINCFIEVNGTAPLKNTEEDGCQAERQASNNKVVFKMLYHCHK